MKNLKKLILACVTLLSFVLAKQAHAQCPTGVDVHVANDISGSVDSREFQQSKEFVSLLGANFGTAYGNGNLETRVSISNWSRGSGRFVEYDFPIAGQDYTTHISDILSYTTSVRPFEGGTDVRTALLRANEWVKQSPVNGRSVPKVIVLLTDASCGQVASSTSSLATQIKNSGVYIVLLAIDAAANCTNINGTQIASPGGYFNAQDYATLQNQAISFINSLRDAACATPPTPFDLTVNLSNFTRGDCDTTPTSSVSYQVNNISDGDNFNGNLQVSFYNGNPTNAGTQYLFTENASTQNIATGSSFSGSSSNVLLNNTSTLYAVANFDGGTTGNEVPLSFNNLSTQITETGEGNVSNNLSSAISRVDTGTCLPSGNIDVKVTNSGLGCDNEVIYFVQVCNTGDADADIDPTTGIVDYPPTAFTFVDKTLVGTDPFVGTTLPAGACADYEYTYTLNANASPGSTYSLSVDVKTVVSTVPDAPTITNVVVTGSQSVDVVFDAPTNNGGEAITSYTATSSPGGITGTLSQSGSGTITVTGLSSNTSYTFTVTATNSVGTSVASAISTSVTTWPEIGDFYQGGVVFYLDGSGGGLVVDVNDLGKPIWGCSGTGITGADGTAIGTGAQNTADIISGCSTTGIAARLCDNLTSNGYNDWFLPSKDELNEIFQNKAIIDNTANSNGGSSLGETYYWSSTERSNTQAWLQTFNGTNAGSQTSFDKNFNNFIGVRAVRAF